MAMTVQQFDRALRHASIIREWLIGLPVAQIAEHHRVTPAAVRAIATRTPGAAEERQRRLADADEAKHQAVLQWSREHPGERIGEGAQALGITIEQMRRWLGERRTLHPSRPPRPQMIPDEQILDAVRLWLARSDGDTREASYRAAAKQHGWPSAATAMTRYGSWKAVLLAAGITPTRRRGRGPSWTDEQLQAVAREYFQTQPPPWSWRGLGRWLRSEAGRPSAQLITTRLGSWSAITRSGSVEVCGTSRDAQEMQ